MEILYQRGNKAFIVEEDGKIFFVNLSSKRTSIIDDITAQELLQSGYWSTYIKGEDDKKIRGELSPLIRFV